MMDTNRLTVNPKRMRTTRRLLGMSQEGLSAATEGRVSRYAIRELEAGRAVPDEGAVAYSLLAALRVPYRFLMGSSYYDDYRETPSWRAVKKIPDYVAEGLRERLIYFVDMYRDLEEYVEDRDVFRSDLSPALEERRSRHMAGAPLSVDAVEEYAGLLRAHICARQESGFACLECITEVMERFGIKVACWPLPAGVSGLSLAYGDGDAGGAVLVNGNHPVERRRFSLAQGWGHLVLPQTVRWQDDEDAGNRFAGALLMPAGDLRREVHQALGGPIKATRDAFEPELLGLKVKYGVSAAALLRRCHDVGLVKSDYNLICRNQGWRGWFHGEPDPRWPGAEPASGYVNLVGKLDDEDRQRRLDKEFIREVRFLETVQ